MREDGCLDGKHAPALQFFFKLTQVTAIEYAHEFRLQKALNCITGHVHCATPADGIQESPRIVHAVFARFPLFAGLDRAVLTRVSAEFGTQGQSEVYAKSSLDLAMKDAFRKMRRFLMNVKGLSEDEAIALMSAAIDFGVTQVVDGNWGVHAVLRKSIFDDAPRPTK